MYESTLNVCFNPNDEVFKDNTYVVFDTETTGFNPGLGDSMIEIGGVKLKDGVVIDRFNELINPGHHIDDAITKVTDIADDDVKDADNEENVTRRFKEWIGTYPLVAHNAKFDKNMLDMAYYKYNLGTLTNPIIDTLTLSRFINRDLKKHSLKALGKFYGVDTGEADEDEDELDNGTSNGTKLDINAFNTIKDIKVDGESIMNIVNNEAIIKTVHKASKTENVNVEVLLHDGTSIVDTYPLHPASNEIEIPYNSLDKIEIDIYVGQHHGADVDAENTGYIFMSMLKQIDGIEKISDLNNLYLLETTAFDNDPKKQDKIADLCTYKNYIRQLGENEVPDAKCEYPFIKYGNKNYVWKFPWCHENWLQMYENIPGKTMSEHIANVYDNIKHVTLLAQTKVGLKNLFKIVSYANTNFLQRNARIPRKLINENREGILVGTACSNGEIFYIAETRSDEDLCKAMEFYDYIEVQPIENYAYLLRNHDIDNMEHLENLIKKIIRCGKKAGKLVIATGDVHNMSKEDRIYREIIVNQNVPGKGRHPLARYLTGDAKYNENNLNIDKLIEDTTYKLEDMDIKVLKYIYALTNIKSIPMTLENIVSIYQIDKGNKQEEAFKNKDDIKKERIIDSLRNLEAAGIITEARNGENVVYVFAERFKYYKKTDVPVSGHIPNQFFRTTKEMIDEFYFLDDEKLTNEIVITNPNKLLDMIDEIEVVIYPDKPFSPIIPHSQETCRDLVFTKAHSMYGDPLPRMIEERIAQEFYGDKILGLVHEKIKLDNPKFTDDEVENVFASNLHDVIMSGYDGVVNLKKKKLMRQDNTLEEKQAIENDKAALGGIIGGGFDVIYLIAQKLVKHSNGDGYLVGSRGSVGSSFVASMMGITECNGLPPHYYCPKCQYSMFEDENGVKYTESDSAGGDLPERDCPKCGAHMIHQGHDMPFATFLGFNADEVPDIDLNFSDLNQADAHAYTKVLFGEDNVYRAGTVGTVADKTAYGYVMGYYEDKNVIKRSIEIERLAIGVTGVKRTTGQHPGGIVVVPDYKEVYDFTPFQYPADDVTSPWRTTHFDYHSIQDCLLKLDILGHSDPTQLRLIQLQSNTDILKVPLDDKATMSIFTSTKALGVTKEQILCNTGTLGIPEFGTAFTIE